MKRFADQTARLTLASLCVWLATGCHGRRADDGRGAQNPGVGSTIVLKELEKHCGVCFPSNAVLLYATDGGGRDPGYGFYSWTVFAPEPIRLPPLTSPGGEQYYVNLSLENAVRFVRAMSGRRRIPDAQAAFGSSWETNGYEFHATLVRSAHGDYLIVDQFRKR
jgi:hypothetical protein